VAKPDTKLTPLHILSGTAPTEAPEEKNEGLVLPPIDRWGEAVPAEGTHCSNCEYLKDPVKMICGHAGFIAWNKGSDKIPATDPKKYCSIWWELADED